MSNQLQGLYLIGEVAGHREFRGVSKQTNKPFVMHFLGVRLLASDPYGGVSETIMEARLTDKQIDGGILAKIQKLEGQNVAVKVYQSSYVKGDKAFVDLNLSNDDDNIVVTEKTAVKAA